MKRSTFTIYEEFRIIDKSVLDSVIRPFSIARQPKYLKEKDYKDESVLIEEPKEVFISSAYYKTEWWYKETLITIKNMLEGKNVGVIFFDYLISLKHKIKTKKSLEREMEKMEDTTVAMEYKNIPVGESSGAYFKLSLFTKNRNMKRAFYPQKDDTFNPKKNPYGIDKLDEEIRVVSVDVATRAGKSNDLTIISCFRLLPTAKGYHREVVYMESHTGKNVLVQAKRIKQIYYDFLADYIVLDLANAGVSIFDSLGVITKDDERGIEYEPMTIMSHNSIEEKTYEELRSRTTGLNPLPVIYPIVATAKINSQIAVAMRNTLQKRLISFLVDENTAEEHLIKTNKEYSMMETDKTFFLNPYVQTSFMINESINLEMTLVSGNIKLEEPTTGRKDRYTSVSYANFFASLLDIDLLREEDASDEETLLSLTGFF